MKSVLKLLVGISLLTSFPAPGAAEEDLPAYQRDRGTGIRTSMFGTYVRRGELLIYPFYEYYRDDNLQYAPTEFGGAGTQDLEGRYRANEGLLFLGYGVTDRLAVEMEVAVISASFERDPTDATGTPARIEESGLGDVEGQVTFRWLQENEHRPEVFSFAEAVIPHARTKPLIGTEDWEVKIGSGVSRGFGFGTMSARIALEYARASSSPWDLGEWALEYLRRVSPGWRVYVGAEGQAVDELSAIAEVQRRLGPHATLKLGTAIGLTANATDLAPELGIMFSFPTGGR